MPRKPSKKGLIKKLDTIFSEVVRGYGSCEKCGNRNALQCAHIYSRKYKNTRWDTLNAVCLCASCHRLAHDRPIDFAKWVESYLGEGTLEELRGKAHSIGRVDIEDMQKTYEGLLVLKSRG